MARIGGRVSFSKIRANLVPAKSLLVLITILAVVWASSLQAPNESPVDVASRLAIHKFGLNYKRESPDTRYGNSWAKRPLRRSERYKRIGDEVAQRMRASSDVLKAVDGYRRRFVSRPESPEAIYGWCYAAVLADRMESKVGVAFLFSSDQLRYLRIRQWFIAANDPNAGYEYTRMRFLTECEFRGRKDLLPLGLRLLAMDPSDILVRREVAIQLASTRQSAAMDEALQLCSSYLKRSPNDLSFVNMVAFIYETRWLAFGHKREDGLEMIKWCRRYIAIAPNGCPNDADQENRIRVIQRELAAQGGGH